MSGRLSISTFAALALALAAGCDYDARLKQCAEDELCTLDANAAPVPTLRYPHNGAGLGSASSVLTTLAWSPTRPYLAWDFGGDANWSFRIQTARCFPGEGLDQCAFPSDISEGVPNTPATTYGLERDLQIGSRYWWRVRACHTTVLGSPCGPWSTPRYFDVGRPEAVPNDLAGLGKGALVVGQTNPANAGQSDKLYLYKGDNAGPSSWTELLVGPPGGVSALTYSTVISGAGDLNGDGYSDLAVGYLLNFGAGTPQPVPVDVYLSGSQGPSPANKISLGPLYNDFGSALGRAGDVNGDGYSDLVVCQAGALQAVVFFGGPSGPSNSTAQMAYLTLPAAQTSKPSCAFAALADVDADGFDDLAVAGGGEVTVFIGQAGAALGRSAANDIPPPTGSTGFGASLAGGDFNGDGHGDLVVSGTDAKAYLYLGGRTWTSGQFPAPIVFDIGPGVVAPAGDVNNDGYADLAVGGGTTGQVKIFYGRATGAPRAGPVITNANLPSFGVAFAGAGDVTDDSFDDLVVGSTNGAVVYRGGPVDGDVAGQFNNLFPPTGSAQFGTGVASGY